MPSKVSVRLTPVETTEIELDCGSYWQAQCPSGAILLQLVRCYLADNYTAEYQIINVETGESVFAEPCEAIEVRRHIRKRGWIRYFGHIDIDVGYSDE